MELRALFPAEEAVFEPCVEDRMAKVTPAGSPLSGPLPPYWVLEGEESTYVAFGKETAVGSGARVSGCTPIQQLNLERRSVWELVKVKEYINVKVAKEA